MFHRPKRESCSCDLRMWHSPPRNIHAAFTKGNSSLRPRETDRSAVRIPRARHPHSGSMVPGSPHRTPVGASAVTFAELSANARGTVHVRPPSQRRDCGVRSGGRPAGELVVNPPRVGHGEAGNYHGVPLHFDGCLPAGRLIVHRRAMPVGDKSFGGPPEENHRDARHRRNT